MSRLTRDGTAVPVSRDQTLRHVRGQGTNHFSCSADHEQDWQPYPVDPYSAMIYVNTTQTYIYIYSTFYSSFVLINAVFRIEPNSCMTRFRLSMEMNRLTRDGTAEPVSREQILTRERQQGNFIFPVQPTTCRIGNLTRLVHTLAICVTIHRYKA